MEQEREVENPYIHMTQAIGHQGKSANTVWILVDFLPGVELCNQGGHSKKIDNEPNSARKCMSLPDSRSKNLPGD